MNDSKPTLGILLGIAAAAGGGLIYALITFLTGLWIGYLSVGVGVLVGLATMSGRPRSVGHAYLAGGLTIVACVVGHMFAATVILQRRLTEEFDLPEPPFGEAFAMAVTDNPTAFLINEPIMLLFWPVAAGAAFGLVFRRVRALDPHGLTGDPGTGEPAEGRERQEPTT